MKKYLSRIYGGECSEFYSLLKNDIKNGKKRFVVTVNPEILTAAENDEVISGMLLDEGTSLVPDGISVVKACKMLDIPVKERIAGVELAEYLLKELNEQKGSLYLFGAAKEVVETLAEKIKNEYSGIRLAGFSDGYVEDKDRVFEEIERLAPDVCMVALGVPSQEKLIYSHYHKLEKGIFVGVGGSFDVLSGTKKRAPDFFLKHNIEWLYRIIKEPKRLKRFYNNNIKFILKIKRQSK